MFLALLSTAHHSSSPLFLLSSFNLVSTLRQLLIIITEPTSVQRLKVSLLSRPKEDRLQQHSATLNQLGQRLALSVRCEGHGYPLHCAFLRPASSSFFSALPRFPLYLSCLPPLAHDSHPLRLDTSRLPYAPLRRNTNPTLCSIDNDEFAFSHCLLDLRRARSNCGLPCRHLNQDFCWPPDRPKPRSLLSHLFCGSPTKRSLFHWRSRYLPVDYTSHSDVATLLSTSCENVTHNPRSSPTLPVKNH